MDKSVPIGAAILLDFIGDIEAPRGYQTIFGNNQAKLPKPITSMSIDEILAAQRSWTKRFGSSATGRYQFMRNTLADLKKELGLSGSQKLTPDLQDRLAYHLLKRRGYERFISGSIDRTEFGKRLAQEWASLPVLKATKGGSRQVKRGQSYYAGDGLNKSLVKPEQVEAVLDDVLAGDDIEDGMAAIAERLAPKKAVPVKAPAGMLKRAAEVAKTEIVFDVQEALRATGFPEVGEVDGRMGSRTRTAISSYRSVRGLPLSEEIDDELVSDMESAVSQGWKRPIAEERATATKEDLADSEVLQNTDRAKRHMSIGQKILTWLGLGGAAAGAAEEAINPDQLESRLGFLQRVGSYAADNWYIAIVLAGIIGGILYMTYASRRVDEAEDEEVQGYREGRHV